MVVDEMNYWPRKVKFAKIERALPILINWGAISTARYIDI